MCSLCISTAIRSSRIVARRCMSTATTAMPEQAIGSMPKQITKLPSRMPKQEAKFQISMPPQQPQIMKMPKQEPIKSTVTAVESNTVAAGSTEGRIMKVLGFAVVAGGAAVVERKTRETRSFPSVGLFGV